MYLTAASILYKVPGDEGVAFICVFSACCFKRFYKILHFLCHHLDPLNINKQNALANINKYNALKAAVVHLLKLNYRIYRMYSDRQASWAWAKSVDPDETPQIAASHQDLHCLQLIQHFLETTSSSKLYLFKFKNKHGKELRCSNI